ncbi:MAG: hypothetical protein A2W21_05885 [Betaproteobacteria bacterium RBG_16_66_20]|nr:MAG: hypothetical protein A2W21_05885 [Betaproteobacteria bacterium RBG_16_66_20]
MGTLLAEQQDLSDLYSIKAVYEALFSQDTNVQHALAAEDLRILSQRRNAVVHRRGRIDALYKKNVHCEQVVGEKLRVSPDELKQHIKTAAIGASALLVAVDEFVKSSPI